MPENRNLTNGLGCDGKGTVCIDTYRVLDCCRDRDCFENARVYLSAFGEEILANATNVRTRNAPLLWAYVGVDEVPFNGGFYQITVRYYILIECEACLGLGKSQNFAGIAVAEKDVILYGGEGRAVSYSSSPENDYCGIGNLDTAGNNDPVAYVETVDPVILGSKVECACNCGCTCTANEAIDFPDNIRERLDGEIVQSNEGLHLYVSLGIFSVVRIQRPAQLLIQATDYSVPDKECTPATNDDDPCSLFRTIAFPVGQFRGTAYGETPELRRPHGGCGCKG